jgi:hypothetical protein
MLEERLKTKKDFEHLVILYSRRCWFDTCRRILMTAEESKDLPRRCLLAMATDMYKSWLMSSGETSVLDINGRSQNLGKIATEKVDKGTNRCWIS